MQARARLSANKNILILLLYFLFSFLGSLNSIAFADDGYAGGIGENPMPRNSKDIVIESEVVYINIFESFAEVECAYKFKNEGKHQKILMGFPDNFDHMENNKGISAFRAYVDGKETPIKRTFIKKEKPSFKKGENQAIFPDSYWFIHEADFKESDIKIITNKYLAPHGATVSPATAFETRFEYILQTGALWKRKIGSIKIIANFAGDLSWDNFDPKKFPGEAGYDKEADYIIYPEKYKKLKDGIEWNFHNIEPNEDKNNVLLVFYRNLEQSHINTMKANSRSWFKDSKNNYHPNYAIDGNIETAWASIEYSRNLKPILEIRFNNPRKIRELSILPGFSSNTIYYKDYARPKVIRLNFSNGIRKRFDIKDDYTVQFLPLEETITASDVKIIVEDIYPAKYKNVFITEVGFSETTTTPKPDIVDLLNGMETKTSFARKNISGTRTSNKIPIKNGSYVSTYDIERNELETRTPELSPSPLPTSPISVLIGAIVIILILVGLSFLLKPQKNDEENQN